jgi:hypothetical protein
MLWLIIRHTPPWVWALLIGLFFLGLIQCRDRNVPGAVVLALPVVMVAFGLDPRVLAAWCAGVLATIVLNQWVFGIPHGVVRETGRWRFLVRGSFLPLVVIMAIFWTRYVLSVLAHMSPATIAGPGVIIGVAFWLGLCGGFFPARGVRVLGARFA